MNTGKLFWYFIAAIAFPLFFVLHGVNEQFGLIRNGTIAEVLLYYLVVAVAVAILSKIIFKEYERSTVYMFIILCVFFFFGAVKDLLKGSLFNTFSRYSIFIPLVVVFTAVLFFLIKGTTRPLNRMVLFVRTLLVVCILLETGILCYNVVTHKEKQKDPGDIDHKIIGNIHLDDSLRKPFIFWIVMDEYAGNTALRRRWDFDNPLNSQLRAKGFFAADSARSPYNYTHYSLVSSLDMTYLRNLREHSVIGLAVIKIVGKIFQNG